MKDWNTDLPPAVSMSLYAGAKFINTALSISLPIPCGLFTPLFTIGAAVGRLFGELLAVITGEYKGG